MNSYTIQPLLSKAVNLLTVEAVATQNLFEKVAATSKSTILTTVEAPTHLTYADQLAKLSKNPNIRVVPYYEPMLYHHYREEKVEFQHKEDRRGVSLLIGNNNSELIDRMDHSRVVTLEELCQAYPLKVPLSFRSNENQEHVKKLEDRLGVKLDRKRVMQFQHIIMVSPYVKMWDEAIQVILDCMPTPFYVPYLKPSKNEQNQHYKLTVDDFLSGLTTIHDKIQGAVKGQGEPKIIRYTQRRQMDWLIGKVAPQAEQMVIDYNFFTNEPKTMEAVEDDIKMPKQLAPYV